MNTFTVEHLATGDATSGLSWAEAVKVIYWDDGEGYELVESEEDSGFYEVWFTKHGNRTSRTYSYLIQGEDKGEAETNMLLESAKEGRYNSGKWCILSDEDYLIEFKNVEQE